MKFNELFDLLDDLPDCNSDRYPSYVDEGWRDWLAAAAIGASTLGGVAGLQAKPVKVSKQLVNVRKPQTVQQAKLVAPGKTFDKSLDKTFDKSFVDYIKFVENNTRKGFNKEKKLWYPHKSFEGGSDTIAYGHKIVPGEDYSSGITEEQAEQLLVRDLNKAKAQVLREVKGRELSKKQMEMFVDFVFNMGTLKKFPKFTKAVLNGDVTTVKAQYKRFSGGKELKGRNVAFARRFFT